jgi:CHAT domain-containing protein/tetratricopeptide (TPR) repeat protein
MKHIASAIAALLIYTSIFAGIPVLANNQPIQQDTQARDTLKKGKDFWKRGDAVKALSNLETALKLFTQSGNKEGIADSNDALGDLYLRQGQYQTAFKYYQDAYAAYTSIPKVYRANRMLSKIGDAYYLQGQSSDASAAYSRMSVKEPENDPLKAASSAKAKVNTGKSLFGRMQSAATTTPSTSTASEVSSIGKDAANQVQQVFEYYHNYLSYMAFKIGMGRVAYANNQLDQAKLHFEDILKVTLNPAALMGSQAKLFRVVARTNLGDIALKQGRYADAIKRYTEAVNGARSDNRLDLMWPAQRGLGASRWLMASQEKDPKKAQKPKEEAIASYREALKTIEQLRAGSLNADEARSTFLSTTKDVFDEASSVLAEMALQSSTSPTAPLTGQSLAYASEAFKVVEQGRARSLLDMLNEAGANITEGLPADLLQRKQENLNKQQDIAQQLMGTGQPAGTQSKSVQDLEAELAKLTTEYESLENQIRSASPKYSSLTAPQPLTLSEVQQQVLDANTVLLEYSLGRERSYLWAVSKDTVMLYRLPARGTVDQQAIAARDQLLPAQLRRQIIATDNQASRGLGLQNSTAATPVGQFASASNALYKSVLEPAQSFIANKRLLIVADGSLNYVPFEALTTSTEGADYSSLSYLVKTNEIVYAPSASVVAIVRQQAKNVSGTGILLVADPVFDSSDPRARTVPAAAKTETANTRGLVLGSAIETVANVPTSNSNSIKLARLNGTRVEAEQIAKFARTSGKKADVWLDLDANEAKIRAQDLKQYRIVHVATHGLLNAERPQFSGLVLSLVGNSDTDGFLRTDEIFNLRLGAQLVMLSACETGLGKEKRGEGVIGLTRALMYAGAPTVGVTLWSVADNSTAELMSDFYKDLLAKQSGSPSTSLRTAQLKMISGKRYSAPFFWAPFVLIGDWM